MHSLKHTHVHLHVHAYMHIRPHPASIAASWKASAHAHIALTKVGNAGRFMCSVSLTAAGEAGGDGGKSFTKANGCR
jgi:hypothetical protein